MRWAGPDRGTRSSVIKDAKPQEAYQFRQARNLLVPFFPQALYRCHRTTINCTLASLQVHQAVNIPDLPDIVSQRNHFVSSLSQRSLEATIQCSLNAQQNSRLLFLLFRYCTHGQHRLYSLGLSQADLGFDMDRATYQLLVLLLFVLSKLVCYSRRRYVLTILSQGYLAQTETS